MSTFNVASDQRLCEFLDSAALWDRLDGMARRVLGVSAAEFVDGLKTDRFRGSAIAGDLAVLAPFARRPR